MTTAMPTVSVASVASVAIEDWTVVEVGEGRVLMGRVYSHPKIRDGHWTMTSLIVSMAPPDARTLNTSYRLGKPMDDDTDMEQLPPRYRSLLASAWGTGGRA